MYYRNPQLLFGQPKLNPLFKDVTHAWPFNESDGTKMRNESKGSGLDFFPQGVTTVSGMTKLSGGVNSYLAAPTTEANVGYSLNTNEAFTWCFTIKPSSLSGTEDLLCKGETVFPVDAEYRVYLNGSTLTFRLYYESTSGVFTNVERTATITNGAENIVFLVFDPANDFISVKVNSAAPLTTAHTAAGKVNRCRGKYGAMTVGNTAGLSNVSGTWPTITKTAPLLNTTSIDSAMKWLMFWKGTALTSTQQADVRTYLLANGFPFPTLPEVSYSLDPSTFADAEKIRNYDLTTFAGQWQDTSKTVAATSDGDLVRTLECQWGKGDAVAPSDAVRYTMKTNRINSNPAGYSNGTDTEMAMSSFQTTEADFCIFIVAKNDRNTNSPAGGSHWASKLNSSYIAQTGYNYGKGYFAPHKSGSGGGTPNSRIILNPDGFNILEEFSVSQLFTAIANGYSGLVGNRDLSNTNPADYTRLFRNSEIKVDAEWWALGDLAQIIMVQRTFTVNERARVRKFLELKHGSAISAVYAGY